MSDATEKLWNELVYAHERTIKGPAADRRSIAAYRNGLLTAYTIITGEPEEKIRIKLMETETTR